MWIKRSEKLPPRETDVLVLVKGEIRIGALFTEHPTFEETFQAYDYWNDPDERACWEWDDITHWMPLPDPPTD